MACGPQEKAAEIVEEVEDALMDVVVAVVAGVAGEVEVIVAEVVLVRNVGIQHGDCTQRFAEPEVSGWRFDTLP